MVSRQGIPGTGQIVIFIDKPHIQPGRAGLAVVAVHAHPLGSLRRERAQHRIILLFRGSRQKAQHAPYIFPAAHARQHCQHAGLIQRILHALVFAQRPPKGRGSRAEKLPAGKRLHHRNAHALGLAPAVQRLPLIHPADGEFAVAVIVRGVDAEHQQVYQPHVQHLVHHLRRVGGKPNVPHGALALQLFQILQRAVRFGLFQVCRLVNAVQKAKIDVVRFQRVQLPGHRAFDVLHLQRPAVFSGAVVRPKVHLVIHLAAAARSRAAICRKGPCVARGHVKKVHAVFQRQLHRGLRLFFARLAQAAVAKADDADVLCAFRQFPVFHCCVSSSCFFSMPHSLRAGAAFAPAARGMAVPFPARPL